MSKPAPEELEQLKAAIVAFAREHGSLPELCNLIDYDPDVGVVPEHWVPKYYVWALAKHLKGYS